MKDSRHISWVALTLLVVLRLAIGWQLLYEGLWKIQTLKTPTPWTSAGYLRNSQGPFRNMFRQMAGDPDDLDLLNADQVASSWDAWEKRFVSHYKLDEKQRGRLHQWINGAAEYKTKLEALPEGFDLPKILAESKVKKDIVRYDGGAKTLVVDGKQHLLPDEREKLISAVPPETPGFEAYRDAVEGVFKASKSGIGYKEKVRAALANPEWVTDKGRQTLGEVDKYRAMLASYERGVEQAKQDFQWDHLQHTWSEIQGQRSQLVNPVKALDIELKEKAQGLLTDDQRSRGPEPHPWTSLRMSDMLTIAGLTILGFLLIVGLGTRLAAITAAFMLFMFYAAMPPWPGVPEVPGPEHSFIVNKNLIEVAALLAIAFLPSGHWFGMDGLLHRWWNKKKTTPRTFKPASESSTSSHT